MQIGVDSFATIIPGSEPTLSPADRVANLLGEAEAADRAGLDTFGIGEHHGAEFIESAPAILFAAIAARTRTIRLQSAVTVSRRAANPAFLSWLAKMSRISGSSSTIRRRDSLDTGPCVS